MIKLRNAKQEDMEFIKIKIKKFKLDPENLQAKQFIIAEDKGKIVGFGRLKPYKDAIEVGALGVVPEYRRKGVARLIMEGLIKMGPKKLYATTDIPEFPAKFGFKLMNNPPTSIKRQEPPTKVGGMFAVKSH